MSDDLESEKLLKTSEPSREDFFSSGYSLDDQIAQTFPYGCDSCGSPALGSLSDDHQKDARHLREYECCGIHLDCMHKLIQHREDKHDVRSNPLLRPSHNELYLPTRSSILDLADIEWDDSRISPLSLNDDWERSNKIAGHFGIDYSRIANGKRFVDHAPSGNQDTRHLNEESRASCFAEMKPSQYLAKDVCIDPRNFDFHKQHDHQYQPLRGSIDGSDAAVLRNR